MPTRAYFSLSKCLLFKIQIHCTSRRLLLGFCFIQNGVKMANLRRVSQNNGLLTPLLAFKTSLVLVSAYSLFVLAKLSIPHISSFLSVALPKIWAALSAWLAPPYLFITVHLIILVIWKLSDQKPRRDHQWAPQQHQPVVKPKQQLSREISPEIPREATRDHLWVPPEEPSVAEESIPGDISSGISREERRDHRLSREISPKKSRDISHKNSPSDESCLTEEESGEKSTASSHLEMRRTEKPHLELEREIVDLEHEQQESMVVEEGEADVDDSIDATWKAIMEKTSRPVVPVEEESVEADEMNQRFEEFIKKSRDQIRLQVEEPSRLHGGFAMAGPAF